MALMDLTNVTVNDPEGNFAIDASSISWTDMSNADTAFSYYDFGAGYITGEWTVMWDFELSNLTVSGEWNVIWEIGVADGLPASPSCTQGFTNYIYRAGSQLRVNMGKNGYAATTNTYELGATGNTGHIYATLIHNPNNSFTLYYHSDAARTNQLHTASFTEDPQAFQHMAFARAMGSGSASTTGFVQNIDVEGFEAPAAGGGIIPFGLRPFNSFYPGKRLIRRFK